MIIVGLYFDLNGRLRGSPLSVNVRTIIELHNYYVIKDGVKILESNYKNNLQLISSLYIFAANQSNSPYTGLCSGKARVYLCKIYDENLMVRNYIPCYSTKEVIDVNNKQCTVNTKGLYDTVEGKFYTNQGTGEFIAGPDVD